MNRLVECVYARTVDSFLYYFRKSGAQTVNSFNVDEMWKKGREKNRQTLSKTTRMKKLKKLKGTHMKHASQMRERKKFEKARFYNNFCCCLPLFHSHGYCFSVRQPFT